MLNDFHRMVLEFFKDFGFTTTYEKTTATPNDDTGGVDIVVEEIEIEAIQLELPMSSNGSGTRAGTLIQDGDQVLYVKPTDRFNDVVLIDPSSDRVIINGVSWKIVSVKSHNPTASDCILYELYIRK